MTSAPSAPTWVATPRNAPPATGLVDCRWPGLSRRSRSSTGLIESIGMAKPMFWASPATAVFIPTT